MRLTHAGKAPGVDPFTWIAPDAAIFGEVLVGPGARILHGARIVGEAGGRISIGAETIVMENAVIRATARHDCVIAENCLIGPGAHVVGAEIVEQVFVATGAAVFHGARIAAGAEICVNAVDHLRTRLNAGATVPIGWIAVGDPAKILPPDRHEEVWTVQAPLDFPRTVYGLSRDTPDLMLAITRSLSRSLGDHSHDLTVA
jgi:carbonic anhydrase/acetyltransferase-like protein (isoleucine patch superfamily)